MYHSNEEEQEKKNEGLYEWISEHLNWKSHITIAFYADWYMCYKLKQTQTINAEV